MLGGYDVRKKLLYISNRVFWPPMGGHEVEMYHYCRGLHDSFGYTVDVYVFDDRDSIDVANKPKFINQVYSSIPISRSAKVWNILTRSLFGKNAWPIQSSLYYSEDNNKKILGIVSADQYDAVFVDMVRLAPYYHALEAVKGKKILDIDDTLSKRYKRQLESLDGNTVIAGQYNEKLPGILQKILASRFVKKKVLQFEIPRMERAERVYGELYDKVVFVSSIETDEFNAKYPGEKAVTVAMGVDYPYFSQEIDVDIESGTASFVGNMKTAANVDSVRMIIEKILPLSKKLQRIDFIGGCPDSLVKEYEGNPRVHFTGRVEDLRPYVKRTNLFLSPLAYGTGIKTKILEAMAMGMPVVTNSIGAEGIPGVNNVHWLTSDNYAKLAEYIDYLIDNPDAGRKIGHSAQEFVKKDFQWEYIFSQFSRLDL